MYSELCDLNMKSKTNQYSCTRKRAYIYIDSSSDNVPTGVISNKKNMDAMNDYDIYGE